MPQRANNISAAHHWLADYALTGYCDATTDDGATCGPGHPMGSWRLPDGISTLTKAASACPTVVALVSSSLSV